MSTQDETPGVSRGSASPSQAENQQRHHQGMPGSRSGRLVPTQAQFVVDISTGDDTSAPGEFASASAESIAAEVDLGAAAQALAAEGTSVFPLVPESKKPLVARGFHAATTDANVVADWWREHPTANIGVPVPSGFLVIDIDLHKSTAARTITALESELGPLPACPAVRTANAGLHYWFSVDPSVRFPATAGPGVDLRVGGSHYVVAPPSRLAGDRRYERISADTEAEPPPLPKQWVERLRWHAPRLRTRKVPAAWERLGLSIESATVDDLDAYLDALPDGPMDRSMKAALRFDSLAERMRAGAHDALVSTSYRVVATGAEGHPGAAAALGHVVNAFMGELDRRVRFGLDGVRSPEEAEGELHRAIFGAIVRVSEADR